MKTVVAPTCSNPPGWGRSSEVVVTLEPHEIAALEALWAFAHATWESCLRMAPDPKAGGSMQDFTCRANLAYSRAAVVEAILGSAKAQHGLLRYHTSSYSAASWEYESVLKQALALRWAVTQCQRTKESYETLKGLSFRPSTFEPLI